MGPDFRAVHAGPVLSLVSMEVFVVVIPWTSVDGDWFPLTLICAALVIGGVDVGLSYPHLSAAVLRVASEGEEDNAASSIMTVQLCATAFGAVIAGLAVILAGATGDGDGLDTANAVRWRFVIVAVAPLLCLVVLNGASFKRASRD